MMAMTAPGTSPLLLLDGASLWFRAYYALPESITAPDGRPVNAVRGFVDMVAALMARTSPSLWNTSRYPAAWNAIRDDGPLQRCRVAMLDGLHTGLNSPPGSPRSR